MQRSWSHERGGPELRVMQVPEARIERIFYGPTFTLGLWSVGGLLLYTMEDEWRDNERGVSCIPDGEYLVRPRRYHRGGYDAWEVTDVPGRDAILVHRGNTADDVSGCIVVGTSLGALSGRVAVLDSAGAWRALLEAFDGHEFALSIGPRPGLAGTGTWKEATHGG